MRDSTPITTNQAVRAFSHLKPEDSQRITAAAEKLSVKTGLPLRECLQVFASIGIYSICHGV